MSATLVSVADALIEFILSLLRDPEEAKKFDAAPQAALADRGLQHVNAQDVCSVAPIIAERHDVVHVVPAPAPAPHIVPSNNNHSDNHDSVVREVQNIVNNLQWVDDRDTIVDQSTNQNIWTNGGDVTQNFDQSAVVASGDDAIAAGAGVDIDQTEDNSTNITAGEDANVGNDTDITTIDDSNNTATDASTTTDDSTTTNNSDSFNDSSTNDTDENSHDSQVTQYNDATVDTDTNAAYDSTDTTIVDDSTVDDGL